MLGGGKVVQAAQQSRYTTQQPDSVRLSVFWPDLRRIRSVMLSFLQLVPFVELLLKSLVAEVWRLCQRLLQRRPIKQKLIGWKTKINVFNVEAKVHPSSKTFLLMYL